jgi:hypothetical protein
MSIYQEILPRDEIMSLKLLIYLMYLTLLLLFYYIVNINFTALLKQNS